MTSFNEFDLITPAEVILLPVSVLATVLFLLFIVVLALARVREPASTLSSSICWTCCHRNRNQSCTDDDDMCTESASVVGGRTKDRTCNNFATDAYDDNCMTFPSEQMKQDHSVHKQRAQPIIKTEAKVVGVIQISKQKSSAGDSRLQSPTDKCQVHSNVPTSGSVSSSVPRSSRPTHRGVTWAKISSPNNINLGDCGDDIIHSTKDSIHREDQRRQSTISGDGHSSSPEGLQAGNCSTRVDRSNIINTMKSIQHRPTSSDTLSSRSTVSESVVNCVTEVSGLRAANRLRQVPPNIPSELLEHHQSPQPEYGVKQRQLHHQHQLRHQPNEYYGNCDISAMIDKPTRRVLYDERVVVGVSPRGLASRPSLRQSAALMESDWAPYHGVPSVQCIHGWQYQQREYTTMNRQDATTRFWSHPAPPFPLVAYPAPTDGVYRRCYLCDCDAVRGGYRVDDVMRGDGCYGDDYDIEVTCNDAAARGNRNSSISTSMCPMVGSCCTSSGPHHRCAAFAASFAETSATYMSQLSSYPPSLSNQQTSWTQDLSSSIDLPSHLQGDYHRHQHHQHHHHHCSWSSESTACRSIGCVYGSSGRLPPSKTYSARTRRQRHNLRRCIAIGSDQSSTTASGSTMTSATVQSAPAVLCSCHDHGNVNLFGIYGGPWPDMTSAEPTLSTGSGRPDVFAATKQRLPTELNANGDHVIGYPRQPECVYGEYRNTGDTYRQNRDYNTVRFGHPVLADVQYWV